MKFIGFISLLALIIYSIFLYGNQVTTISHGPGVAAIYRIVYRSPLGGSGGGTAFLMKHPFTKETIAITNHHVCRLAPKSATWELEKLAAHHTAKVIRISKRVDLCMLSVKYGHAPFTQLHTLKLAKKGPQQGEEISITGYALLKTLMTYYGVFNEYVKLPYDPEEEVMSNQFAGEISIPIIPGNSGSPVVNTDGEVIGVAFAYTANGTSFFVTLKDLHYFLTNPEG